MLFSKSYSELEILIYDINGRIVDESKLKKIGLKSKFKYSFKERIKKALIKNKSRINLNPNISKGLYFIKVINSSQSIVLN